MNVVERIARALADFDGEEKNWRRFQGVAFAVVVRLEGVGWQFPKIDKFDEAACAAGFSTREEAMELLMNLAIQGAIPEFWREEESEGGEQTGPYIFQPGDCLRCVHDGAKKLTKGNLYWVAYNRSEELNYPTVWNDDDRLTQYRSSWFQLEESDAARCRKCEFDMMLDVDGDGEVAGYRD